MAQQEPAPAARPRFIRAQQSGDSSHAFLRFSLLAGDLMLTRWPDWENGLPLLNARGHITILRKRIGRAVISIAAVSRAGGWLWRAVEVQDAGVNSLTVIPRWPRVSAQLV